MKPSTEQITTTEEYSQQFIELLKTSKDVDGGYERLREHMEQNMEELFYYLQNSKPIEKGMSYPFFQFELITDVLLHLMDEVKNA